MEAVSTQSTNKRLDVRVEHNVLVPVMDIAEAFLTQVASIWPFACVPAHVVSKFIGLGKGLVTLAAGESLHFGWHFGWLFLTCVDPDRKSVV